METKLNIIEILKNKPKGTKLYSPLFGDVYLSCIKGDVIEVEHHGRITKFFKGRYYNYPESKPLLFPSKKMQNWFKFAWNPGDILVNKDGNVHIIFEGFDDDTYETFNGNNYLWENEGITMCFGDYEDDLQTLEFYKANKEDAQKYIHKIEGRLVGKFNLETLVIEKAQSEFKKGDIAFADYGYKQAVFIVSGKTDLSEGYNSFIALDLSGLTLDMGYRMSFFKKDLSKLRLATEEEKQQLFDALAKENKTWDSEHKMVVDLKPKWTPKPFDRVITRVDDDAIWTANIFSHIDQYGEYVTIGCEGGYSYCLPYNEETAKLIGTTKDVGD